MAMNERNPFAFLPVPDRYIETKMDPSTRVGVVVPVYKEYGNGNIFRLIDSFSKQKANSDSFEVLCVINNPRKDAISHSPAYLENQETLRLGQILALGSEVPQEMGQYRRGVIERAKEKGLVLNMVDLTEGGVEGNMGIARQVGVIEMVKRYREAGNIRSGIIAHMDCDTVVGRDYVSQLAQLFSSPDVESAALNYDYVVPTGDELLFQTTKQNELHFWYFRLQRLLKGTPIIASPQIVATAQAHIKVGGVPLRTTQEDLVLADNLQSKTKFISAPHITVYAADRARMESFDGRGRYLTLDTVGSVRATNPSSDILKKALHIRKFEHPDSAPSVSFLEGLFAKCGISFDRDQVEGYLDQNGSVKTFDANIEGFLKNYEAQHEASTTITLSQYADVLYRIITNWSEGEEGELLEENIQREKRQQKLRYATNKRIVSSVLSKASTEDGLLVLDSQYEEFFTQNPWVPERIKSFATKNTTINQWEVLQQEFPDLLGEWREDLHGSIALLKGIYTFILHCQQDRGKYLGVGELLRYF